MYRPQPQELVEKIAKKHGVPKEMIYITAGIDEALQMYAVSFGSHAYVFTPTYIVYTDVEVFHGKLTRIDAIRGSEYKIPTDTIPDATLIYLANPNNPSGITSREDVLELVKNNSHAQVVIDEAYGEFAKLSVIDHVKDYPHMTVLRSFSKAYGMAGNRVGYIIAHPEVIQKVKDMTQWSNVSYLSAGAAMIALEHEEYFAEMRENISKRRDEFMKFLKQSGFSAFPSMINAVLLKFSSKDEGTKFAEYLKDNNIHVSHGNGNSNIGLDESYVRIAIGNEGQMSTLQDIIGRYRGK